MSFRTWMRSLATLAFVLATACVEPTVQSEGNGDGDDDTGADATGTGGDGVCVDMDQPNFSIGPCQPNELPEQPDPAQLEAGGENNQCESHADCTEGLNGRCVWLEGFYYGCIYDDCSTHEDCEAGELCACAGRHQCVPFNCMTDEDCEGDATCRWDIYSCDGRLGGRYCHTPNDTCCSNADCPEDEVNQVNRSCQYDNGFWGCAIVECYD